MPDMSKVLSELEEESQNMFPTPPIGESVTWYRAGDKTTPIAAIVTKIEGPGKVGLTCFSYRSHPSYVEGVFYHQHPIHQTKGNPTTNRCGMFAYPGEIEFPQSKKPHASHYSVHQQDVQKRRADALARHEVPVVAPKTELAKA
jgi:hypothetical protein